MRDRPTDGRTDGWTKRDVESLSTRQKSCANLIGEKKTKNSQTKYKMDVMRKNGDKKQTGENGEIQTSHRSQSWEEKGQQKQLSKEPHKIS